MASKTPRPRRCCARASSATAACALTGLGQARGARLGIYGFGAAGHVVIQLAHARGFEVYLMTRDRARHQALAAELGAAWVGDAAARPPVALAASIVFSPAGELVPPALAALAGRKPEVGELGEIGVHRHPANQPARRGSA
jgi:propanol-preferring alcohol dehydrogenase